MSGAAKPRRAAESASRIVFWLLAFAGLGYVFLKAYELAEADTARPALEAQTVDFLAFWAAAKLALAGEALSSFDADALAAAAGVSRDQVGNLLWLYPPGFLVLIMPLGALAFWAAWTVFVLGSAVCLALAVRGPAAVLPGGWRLVVVSPVVLVACLAIGQNSVLWTAALVAALWAMRPGRGTDTGISAGLRAGLFIALLTLKPQLGLLIPVALAAAGQWRVMAWAVAWTLAIAMLSTAAFGPGYWGHFIAALGDAVGRIEQGGMPIQRMASFYGFARALDAGHAAALWSQYLVSGAVLVATAWIWRRGQVAHDLKCAWLCAAIPLATPYAFYYETTLALAAAVFLIRDGFGAGTAAKLWLLALWLGPVPALYLPSYTSIAATTPPVLLATAILCLMRARRGGCDPGTSGPAA